MSMRFINQAEAPEPAEPAGGGETGVGKIDYQLLRRLEFEAGKTPDGIRPTDAGSTKAGGPQGQKPSHVPGRKDPLVTLVSVPWDGEEEEDEDYEEEEGPGRRPGEIVAGPPEPQMIEEEISGERVPKVIVVDRAGKLAVDLGRVAEDLTPEPEVLKLDRPTEIVEVALSEDPDVIIFGLEEVNGAGLKRLAQVHKAQPKIVIVLSDNRRKTWSAAQMAASGASDFLPANPSRGRLRTKLAAALATAEQLRTESIVVTERVVIQEPAPVEPPRTSSAPRRWPVSSPSPLHQEGAARPWLPPTWRPTWLRPQAAGCFLSTLTCSSGR